MAAIKTHDRILDQGLRMACVTGLSGVTFGALADAVGMSKSGLFAHFRSKEDIQIRLMSHAEALVAAKVVAPAMAEAPGLPRLVALMRHWLGWTRRAGLEGGCPIASALFELDDLDGVVRTHVAHAEARTQALLATLAGEAVAAGALHEKTDIDQLVWELRGIYLGHHVASRFVRDSAADRRAWTAFEALLDRYRP